MVLHVDGYNCERVKTGHMYLDVTNSMQSFKRLFFVRAATTHSMVLCRSFYFIFNKRNVFGGRKTTTSSISDVSALKQSHTIFQNDLLILLKPISKMS